MQKQYWFRTFTELYVYIKHRFGMYFNSFAAYMYMLCFYNSDDTESFLIDIGYKSVFSVHY